MGMGYESHQHYDYDDQHPQLNVDPNNNNFTDNSHSPSVYGFGVSTPNPDHVSPFEPATADDTTFTSDGPMLPDPSQMQEEGHARREWRRSDLFSLHSSHFKCFCFCYYVLYVCKLIGAVM